MSKSTSTTLAAGTYLVGDPCYAFDNDQPNGNLWSEWLKDSWKDHDGPSGSIPRINEGRVRGMRVVASGTAYGDGSYTDGDGFEYGVDAGLLGAVHIGFLRNLYPSLHGLPVEELEMKTGMRVVEFAHPFAVSYEDGWVTIGHLSINTGWDEDDEDEETCSNCGGDCGDGFSDRTCMDAEDEDSDED